MENLKDQGQNSRKIYQNLISRQLDLLSLPQKCPKKACCKHSRWGRRMDILPGDGVDFKIVTEEAHSKIYANGKCKNDGTQPFIS